MLQISFAEKRTNRMKEFPFWKDVEIVQGLLDMTTEELAAVIGVSRMTLNRWKNGEGDVSEAGMAAFYSMAFQKKIHLNKIKEQFYQEDYADDSHAVLFHGAKTNIEGELSLLKSRANNDFGQGLYCGESLEQSAMFVSNFPKSSLYIVNFDRSGLNCKKFRVDREWMLTIAYFRGRLKEYEQSPAVHELIQNIQDIDYIIAPIADNRMFEIIDSFIDGEITDVQCRHCLSATNLGNQYVFTTQRALDQVKILTHCYLAQEEKMYYLESRKESEEVNRDKVKVARKQYRGQGHYIEEILQ